MTHFIASRSLADALHIAQHRDPVSPQHGPVPTFGHGNLAATTSGSPMIDQLATALAVPQAEPSYFDDIDDDLDLPMLVQGDRYGEIVPTAAERRLREGRAGLMGFGLGLLLLVPISAFMGARLSGSSDGASTDRSAVQVHSTVMATASGGDVQGTVPAGPTTVIVRTSEIKPSSQIAAGGTAAAPADEATLQPSPADSAAQDAIVRLEAARAMIDARDVVTARSILEPLAADGNAEAMMMFAETFDPTMLAAWGVRSPTADAAQARGLYQRALALGHMPAQLRLKALE